MKEIRVLHVLNGLSGGGAESFILNLYRNIDTGKIKFDFLLRTTKNNPEYIKEVKKLGSKVYITSAFPRHFLRNFRETKKILKENSYDIIHVHANSLMYVYPLYAAKKEGVSCRIIHSHNSTTQFGILCKMVHYINRCFIRRLANYYFACGQMAGKWLFGNAAFQVIPNAIDREKFNYEEGIRNRIRKELGVEECFVIGSVGRFSKQKNHAFMISVFAEYLKQNQKAVLLLAGTGELQESVKKQVWDMGLEKNVLFLGQCSNVNELLQAMDLFIMTSLFEGLPFALLEAQAAGLDVLASDVVTEEVNVTGRIHYFSLKKAAKEWADEIEKIRRNENTREIDEKAFEEYDIVKSAKKMEEFYTKSSKINV